jgi:GNAT superfamily N-acetyltransferase
MMASGADDPRKAGTIWVLDLEEEVRFVFPAVYADFVRLGPEAASELVDVMNGATLSEILGRFENGRRCYAARVGGKLAAYGWVSFDEEFVGELRLRLKLLPGEAYIWDCATLPEYRRQRLYSALLSYILSDLRFGQFRRAWIGANLDNEPSQRGIARAGFHHVANLEVERVLGMRMVWVEGWPGVPESLVDEARRVFLGDRDQIWRSAITRALNFVR